MDQEPAAAFPIDRDTPPVAPRIVQRERSDQVVAMGLRAECNPPRASRPCRAAADSAVCSGVRAMLKICDRASDQRLNCARSRAATPSISAITIIGSVICSHLSSARRPRVSELDRIIDNELPVLAPDPRAQRAPAEEAIRPYSRSAADLIPAAIRPLFAAAQQH